MRTESSMGTWKRFSVVGLAYNSLGTNGELQQPLTTIIKRCEIQHTPRPIGKQPTKLHQTVPASDEAKWDFLLGFSSCCNLDPNVPQSPVC